jgi:2-polyprenyl-3-methyl-5-hydroxy-6-metoxy-1,4-benzoquinol methylase
MTAMAPDTLNHTGADRERALTALIDRWTAHMRWRKGFDRWREDRLWQEETQAKRLRAITREIGELRGKKILDIGSGMGGFLVAAARNGAKVAGLEPNGDYCTITRLRASRYDLPAAVVQGYGEQLPYASGIFDVVVAQDILEHVQDPMSVLAEIHRVLTRDGVALVTVINRYAWRDPHYHLSGLNWLPRQLAERVVAIAGRSKTGSRFTDNQRLSDMYYDTYQGFVRRAAALGFAVTDVRERTLHERNRLPTGARGRIIRLLQRLDVDVTAYRTFRFAVLGTYEIVLRRQGSVS